MAQWATTQSQLSDALALEHALARSHRRQQAKQLLREGKRWRALIVFSLAYF